jgi:hypothetical protein
MNHAHVIIAIIAAFAAGQVSVAAVFWTVAQWRPAAAASWRHRAEALPSPPPARSAAAMPPPARGEVAPARKAIGR